MLGSLTLLPKLSSSYLAGFQYIQAYSKTVWILISWLLRSQLIWSRTILKSRYIWGQHVKVYLQLFFQDFATLENEDVKQYGPVSA